MLPRWDEIDAWRVSLPPSRQQVLNNPREVERVCDEEHRAIGEPDAKPRPSARIRRKFPSLLEQYTALVEQYQLAEERAEAAEHQRDYFAAMMDAVATQAKLDDDQMAEIRIKVRADREDAE